MATTEVIDTALVMSQLLYSKGFKPIDYETMLDDSDFRISVSDINVVNTSYYGGENWQEAQCQIQVRGEEDEEINVKKTSLEIMSLLKNNNFDVLLENKKYKIVQARIKNRPFKIARDKKRRYVYGLNVNFTVKKED